MSVTDFLSNGETSINVYSVETDALQVTNTPFTGAVLTSDAAGNATWQAAGGGLVFTADCPVTGPFANSGQTVSCMAFKNGLKIEFFFPGFDCGVQTGVVGGYVTLDISAFPFSFLPALSTYTYLIPVWAADEGQSINDSISELEVGPPNNALYWGSPNATTLSYGFSGTGDLFLYAISFGYLSAV